jgi:hypothetical protein
MMFELFIIEYFSIVSDFDIRISYL